MSRKAQQTKRRLVLLVSHRKHLVLSDYFLFLQGRHQEGFLAMAGP